MSEFKAKPFVDGAHIVITDKDLDIPANYTSTNNTRETVNDPKTDEILMISDDEQIYISSDDEDYIFTDEEEYNFTDSDADDSGDDIIVDDASDYDTILVEPVWECIKLEDISDEETENINTSSIKENTPPKVRKSRKRKDNPFVKDVRSKKARGS